MSAISEKPAQEAHAAQSHQDPPKPEILKHNPPDIWTPLPQFTHVATVPITGNTTLAAFAGQIGRDIDGNTVPTYTGQVEVALANLKKCLASAGCGPESIIKVTHYLVGPPNDADDEARRTLYTTFLGGCQAPPSTVIRVAALATPQLLYEIEAMAVVRK